MIPKEFKETIVCKMNYDEYEYKYNNPDLTEEEKNMPPPEVQLKEYKESPEYKLKKETKLSFIKEYKEHTKSKSYFLGCTYDTYTSTYETRLNSFKSKYFDAEEHNFIIDELDLINRYKFSDFIDHSFKKSIGYSLQKTQNFLREKLESLGYTIENRVTKQGDVKSIAIKDASVIKLENEPSIDFSDSNAKDKIRYLYLIGFFEFIKKREPDLNTNKVASLLSAFTDCSQSTIQPYINPILSNGVRQDKNPTKDSKKMTEARNKLINLGINKMEFF